MPTGKNLAWMAAVSLAVLLAFESYKAKKMPAGGVHTTLFGRAT